MDVRSCIWFLLPSILSLIQSTFTASVHVHEINKRDSEDFIVPSLESSVDKPDTDIDDRLKRTIRVHFIRDLRKAGQNSPGPDQPAPFTNGPPLAPMNPPNGPFTNSPINVLPLDKSPVGGAAKGPGNMKPGPTGNGPQSQSDMKPGPTGNGPQNPNSMKPGPTGNRPQNPSDMKPGSTGNAPQNPNSIKPGPTGNRPQNPSDMKPGSTGNAPQNPNSMKPGPTGNRPQNPNSMKPGSTGNGAPPINAKPKDKVPPNVTVSPIKVSPGRNVSMEPILVAPTNKTVNATIGDEIVPTTEVSVIGMPNEEKEKFIDKVMDMEPVEPPSYLTVSEAVHTLLAQTQLKNDTENYVRILNQRYDSLPMREEDNNKWRKFSRAIVEAFVLDFASNYKNGSLSSWAKLYQVEAYNNAYFKSLESLQRKKGLTAVQFAAPVRRAMDIHLAVLDAPVGIVQTKCKTHTSEWLCQSLYLARLAEASEVCEYVWYHALVHLQLIKHVKHVATVKDATDLINAELEKRLAADLSLNNANDLFDMTLQTLADLGPALKKSLTERAADHSFVKELLGEDKLRCLDIDMGSSLYAR